MSANSDSSYGVGSNTDNTYGVGSRSVERHDRVGSEPRSRPGRHELVPLQARCRISGVRGAGPHRTGTDPCSRVFIRLGGWTSTPQQRRAISGPLNGLDISGPAGRSVRRLA
jgi:hypothetical protein